MKKTREYEIMAILRPDWTEQEQTSAIKQITDVITRFDGEAKPAQNMGRRKLSFPIARQMEGWYHLIRFTLETERLKELERGVRLADVTVRFMIVVVEDGAISEIRERQDKRQRPYMQETARV